ncbi:hypothetical protein TrCOL_g12592 [Triparma columacea]|uniref:Uncharacterized protein n=1 Tax=Triparma columacea TaxID=722753 RepID=A0A9W7GQ49_9STRA|nr:hypothetical protein TrCOL_g12592 [Triparma columacea]
MRRQFGSKGASFSITNNAANNTANNTATSNTATTSTKSKYITSTGNNNKAKQPLATDTLGCIGLVMGKVQPSPRRQSATPSVNVSLGMSKPSSNRPSSSTTTTATTSSTLSSSRSATTPQPSASTSSPLITLASPPSPYVPDPSLTLHQSPLTSLKSPSNTLFSSPSPSPKPTHKTLKTYSCASLPLPKPDPPPSSAMDIDLPTVRPHPSSLPPGVSGYSSLPSSGSGAGGSKALPPPLGHTLTPETVEALGDKGCRVQVLVDIYKTKGCDREAFIREVGRVLGGGQEPKALKVFAEVL